MRRLLLVLAVMSFPLAAQVPELLWYQLNEGGGAITANSAPSASAVGFPSAPVYGHQLRPGVGCGGSGGLRGMMAQVNYIETGWQPTMPPGSPWSVGFFVDWTGVSVPNSQPEYYVFATSRDPANTAFVSCTMWFNATPSFQLDRSDGNFHASTMAIATPGRHLVVWTYDPATHVVQVSVDAVVTNTNSFLSPIFPGWSVAAGQTLRVGGRNSPMLEYGLPYDVVIDDLRIFSHTLSQAEISSWYASCPSWSSWVSGPVPANDSCASAIAIGPGTNGPFTTRYATPTPGWTPGACSQFSERDVWFSYTPAWSGPHEIGTCALTTPLLATDSHWTLVQVFSPPCSASPTPVTGCSNTCSTASNELGGLLERTTAYLTGGSPYLIRVADPSGLWRGDFNLTITQPPPPPPNDPCSAAVLLPANGPVTWNNVSAATTPGLPPAPCAPNTSRDVWFSYAGAACTTTVTLSTCTGLSPSALDTVITVYTGSCGALTVIACDDDGCLSSYGNHGSTVTFTASAGTTYLVAVSIWANGPGGYFTLTTRTVGQIQPIGGGCGSPLPNLLATLPAANAPFSLKITNGGPNSSGLLVVSPSLASGVTPLPGGCNVLLDLSSYSLIPFSTDGVGAWKLSTQLPPMLACFSWKLQAVLLSPGASNYRTSAAWSFVVGP